MKLIKFEFLKIITSKVFLVPLLVLLSANFIFLNYGSYLETKDGIPYQAYHRMEDDLKGKTIVEKGEFIGEQYERVYAIHIIYNIQNNLKSENAGMREYGESLREENRDLYDQYYEEAKNDPAFPYTGDITKELTFLEEVKNGYDQINHYQDLIQTILAESDDLQGISIFNEPKDDISIKNIRNTTDAYQKMLSTKVNFELDHGVKKLISLTFTDYFVLILIFILATILMSEEKEKNLFAIIRTTKNGQVQTILAKIATLFCVLFIVCLLFYGMNFLYYFVTIGYGNVFSTIQSLPIFIYSTFKVNIMIYFLVFFASKILTLFLIAMIMFCLAVSLQHSVEVVSGVIVILLFSFLLDKGIDIHSPFNLLKALHFLNLLDTNEIYRIYHNLQFGPFLFEKASILIILQSMAVFCLLILSVWRYSKMNMKSKNYLIWTKLSNIHILKNMKFHRVFQFETFKLLFSNQVWIIFILFVLFLGFHYRHQNFNLSLNEAFYKNYMDVLSGDLTDDKEAMIQNTIKEYEQADNELTKIANLIETGALSIAEGNLAAMPYEDVLATREMFMRVQEKYEYVKEHCDASFVYDSGYQKLLRIGNVINENDIYLLIVTALSIPGLFIMEYKTGMIHILNATKQGRKKTIKNKIMISMLIAAFLFIISVIAEIMSAYQMYGMENLTRSIISIPYFKHWPPAITIWQYMILFYCVRYLSYAMLVLFIVDIALIQKNFVYAFVSTAGIFLMPIIIHLCGFQQMMIFPFMNLSSMQSNVFYLIWIPIIAIIMIFLYNDIMKRWE